VTTETQPIDTPTPATPAKAAPAQPRRGHQQGHWTGLRARYYDEVVPALQKEFGYGNPNQVPKLTKIVINIGLGEALTNAKALDAAVGDLSMITGQKPIVTRARRSIAQFRLRTGNPIGAKVTLRGQRMWDFLERLTRLALPRIRDFRGVPSRSFDGRGNYSLGLREQLAFPEIDYDKIDRLRGLEVSIITSATTDEESKRLLQLLGMPFAG
jgi:large subunit ribosomal protein L5